MSKFRVLAKYHIRKNKGQYISFSILVIIASLVFGIGLITARNFGKTYVKKFNQYKCADVFYTLYNNDMTKEFLNQAAALDGVEKAECRENIMLSGDASYGDSGNTLTHIFFNADEKHEMNTLKIIGESLDPNSVKNPIYISYWIKANGCKIGDTYTFVSGETTYEFTIVGFVEDLMYGNNNCMNMGVYLPEKDFQAMYASVAENVHAKTLSLRLCDRKDGKAVFTKLSKMLAGTLKNNYEYNYGYFEMCQRNRTVTASIVASMLVAFSTLLVLITMLVINFRIKSSIQEEMQNMGVMTAMGYTGKQVIWSISIPYLLLGALSVLLGTVCSYLFLPVVEQILEKMAGLSWRQGLDLVTVTLVVAVILGLILFTTLFSARRIRRLHPIEALRSGIKHHSFKKNYFELAKAKANVHLTLGLKGITSNSKQCSFLFAILVVASFTMTFMVSGLYNSMVEPDNFINLISEENPMISLKANSSADAKEILEDLNSDSRVEQAIFYSTSTVIAGDDTIAAFVLDDYSKLKNDICYKGRTPKHDNEVVLGCATADTMHVSIGDSITVKNSSNAKDYVIVGLLQAPDYNGAACEMTTAGFTRLNTNFEQATIYVYLKDASTSASYTNEITTKYKDQLAGYSDQQSMLDDVYDNFIPLMVMIVGLVSVIIVVLVIVVLYMIIKTLVSHRKQELGILKALGYTTGQLVLQMVYSLVPAIACGSLLGGIIGYAYISKLWLLCFYGLGIRSVALSVPAAWTILLICVITMFATVVSILLSRRIKRISTIKLIRE